MQLLWSKQIVDPDMWAPYYDGHFCKIGDKVHFFYKGWSETLHSSVVRAITQDAENSEVVLENSGISLPNKWILVDENERKYLFLTDDTALDLLTMEVNHNPPIAVELAYKMQRKPEFYYEEASFYFAEYCISHKGNWGYICRKNDEKIWGFTGHGYLYTDIKRWNDRLFFGTAGQGGYFYILDMETGQPLIKLKTGGTTSIVQEGNFCYVLRNDKKAKLVCVDLRDGGIQEEIDLPAWADGYHSKLCLINGNIHAITFEMKKDILQSVYWSCIAI